MGENSVRLNKVIREFNISLERVVEFLSSKGHDIDAGCGQLVSISKWAKQLMYQR